MFNHSKFPHQKLSLIKLIPYLLVFLLISAPAFAWQAWEAKVINVADGDIITVLTPDNQQVTIRLYGIDCPERNQAFGNRARQATQKLVDGKTVEIQTMNTDRYGRTVALVFTPDGSSLNELLVRDGMAWVYLQYCTQRFICDPMRKLEAAVRAERRGLWTDKNPIAPWEWRKQNRESGKYSTPW